MLWTQKDWHDIYEGGVFPCQYTDTQLRDSLETKPLSPNQTGSESTERNSSLHSCYRRVEMTTKIQVFRMLSLASKCPVLDEETFELLGLLSRVLVT